MKKLQYILTLLLLLGFIFLWATGSSGQTKLPGSWQPGMVLKLSYGGGMRYYSSEIEIKETGSYRLVNEAGKEKRDDLSFTKKELDDLLLFLKSKKFDTIHSHSRDGIVYDMGTTSTTLQWGNTIMTISIGATEDIPDADRVNYAAISLYINNLVNTK